jgi:anaerobic ribonucleoside-triphosphate reductase activating protein
MQELLDLLRPNYIRGLTFSGGDPLFVQNRFIVGYICERVRKEFGDSKDIWMWTGYEWDDIKDWDHLHYIDVLVDGPYIEAEHDISLPWAGSKNQRVIDVKKSLERGEVVLWK